MRTLASILLVAAAASLPAACKKSEGRADPGKAPPATPVAGDSSPDAGAPASSKIDWIEDDYDAAMARAKKDGKPVLVDLWAPWCHTCLSMKQKVLSDPGLADRAGRFVWLGVDTDKPENAPVVAKLPISVWPSYFVLAPDGSVAGRLQGGVTVAQFREFLDQGERAAREGAKLAEGSPAWHLREGDRLAAAGDNAKAAAAYAAALEAAPADWARRPDVMVAEISSLAAAGDFAACAKLGGDIDETLASKSASTTDFSIYANGCAEKLGKGAASKLRPKLIAAIEKVLGDPEAGLSLDDRSDALSNLREYYLAQGDEQKALMAAGRQRKVLDKAVAAASSPRQIMTYSWPRAEVYTYLEIPEKLVGELEKLSADLPEEYDPPYRLAWLEMQMGEYDKALRNAAKALELAYGPRKGKVMALIAAIHESAGDAGKARKTRQELLAYLEALPEGQRSEAAIAEIKAALAKK